MRLRPLRRHASESDRRAPTPQRTHEELREVFASEIDLHLTAVSPGTRAVLRDLVQHEWFPGSTDPGGIAVLLAIVRGIQPRLVLELGTLVGFSALCIADVLEHNNVKGELVTVDPTAEGHAVAAEFLEHADLSHRVRFVRGLSTDPVVAAELLELGPFDLVYLDSSHSYAGTLQELDLLFDRGGWVGETGLLVAHDAAPDAAAFDPTGAGGVPRALAEWVGARRDGYDLFVLAPPLWPNGCGLGLLQRRRGRREERSVT
jgi:predicted O-methyltransferase YrrM